MKCINISYNVSSDTNKYICFDFQENRACTTLETGGIPSLPCKAGIESIQRSPWMQNYGFSVASFEAILSQASVRANPKPRPTSSKPIYETRQRFDNQI